MTIPLYYQIYRDLQYKICEGLYKPGAMLPTEADLEKIYGTSRAPVRQALGALENEGLVLRLQGKGTFVTKQVRTRPWFTATGFVNVYEQYWDRLSTQTLEISLKIPHDQDIQTFLNLGKRNKRPIWSAANVSKKPPSSSLNIIFRDVLTSPFSKQRETLSP